MAEWTWVSPNSYPKSPLLNCLPRICGLSLWSFNWKQELSGWRVLKTLCTVLVDLLETGVHHWDLFTLSVFPFPSPTITPGSILQSPRLHPLEFLHSLNIPCSLKFWTFAHSVSPSFPPSASCLLQLILQEQPQSSPFWEGPTPPLTLQTEPIP